MVPTSRIKRCLYWEGAEENQGAAEATHQDTPQFTLIEQVVEALSEQDSEWMDRALSIILNAAIQVERQQTLGAAPVWTQLRTKGVCQRIQRQKACKPCWQDSTKGSACPRRVGVLSLLDWEGDQKWTSTEAGDSGDVYQWCIHLKIQRHRREAVWGGNLLHSGQQGSAATGWRDRGRAESAAWSDQVSGPGCHLWERTDRRFGGLWVRCDGRRRTILGVSTSISEAEVHWRAFLQSLLKRGPHGV